MNQSAIANRQSKIVVGGVDEPGLAPLLAGEPTHAYWTRKDGHIAIPTCRPCDMWPLIDLTNATRGIKPPPGSGSLFNGTGVLN